MTPLDASAVSRLLREFGQRVALRPGNPYRAKAYARAADNLLTLSIPLEEVVAQDRLREIPGVGEAIADIITQLHSIGTHPTLEAMRKEVPESLLELLTIPGLRPDKILKLHAELGISSLAELEEAARAGRLQNVKGLGAALQSKILKGIEIRRNAPRVTSSPPGRRAARSRRAASAKGKSRDHARDACGRISPRMRIVGKPTLVAEVKTLSPGSARDPGQRSTHGSSHRCAPLWRHALACHRR